MANPQRADLLQCVQKAAHDSYRWRVDDDCRSSGEDLRIWKFDDDMGDCTKLPLKLLGPSDRLDLPSECGSEATTVLALVGEGMVSSEVLFYEASPLTDLPPKLPLKDVS
ncbi:hypothetical protein FOZ62_004833 [Perkinsus olseni]|uniref:Uncharacterized protein n=1 Tax=Perkinsus olseni TaxID=32597 RepID=A0A7J6SQU7_PEROL|nr:hypothetical protein FOZ62_004833 [Perkinsus olseni]